MVFPFFNFSLYAINDIFSTDFRAVTEVVDTIFRKTVELLFVGGGLLQEAGDDFGGIFDIFDLDDGTELFASPDVNRFLFNLLVVRVHNFHRSVDKDDRALGGEGVFIGYTGPVGNHKVSVPDGVVAREVGLDDDVRIVFIAFFEFFELGLGMADLLRVWADDDFVIGTLEGIKELIEAEINDIVFLPRRGDKDLFFSVLFFFGFLILVEHIVKEAVTPVDDFAVFEMMGRVSLFKLVGLVFAAGEDGVVMIHGFITHGHI